MMPRRMAIVGAGPVGLEAALAALRAEFDVSIYELGRVGEHLRQVEQVRLFTPFQMNSTNATRLRLAEVGCALPSEEAFLTAGEYVARYLDPIAALPELFGRIHVGTRVCEIGRDGFAKAKTILDGTSARGSRPFWLRVESSEGERFEEAEVVIDAGGIFANPLAAGPGGVAALGEGSLGDRIERSLAFGGEASRARHAGKRVLLIGTGHSAATALVDLASDSPARRPARLEWVHRDRGAGAPFAEWPDDPLPERLLLARRANAIAREWTALSRHPGRDVFAFERLPDGAIEVRLRAPDGRVSIVTVDVVLALVGYRPDTSLYRELQVHLCYATEGPMALAKALLSARQADPGAAGDCLSQTTHGPESLRTPEPAFFVLGAKSYGRSPDFLLRVGFVQVAEVFSLLAADRPADRLEAAT